MDELKKRALLEASLARVIRNLGQRSLNPFTGEPWSVPTDIYETEQAFVIHMDLAGVDPGSIQVVAEERGLSVSGERHFPRPEQVLRVHRLEIEQGRFSKRISLPTPIAVDAAETSHHHGFLVIVLPKLQRPRVKITVR